MNWTNVIMHRIARLAGVDYRRYNAANFVCLRRAQIMRELKIRMVVDVGAHDGGYGLEIRQHGYHGGILSLEPLSKPYEQLERVAREDRNWRVKKLGAGSVGSEMTINVSNHPTSSSLLGMSAAHEKACPGSAYCGVETVRIERLDRLVRLDELRPAPTWLKVDVQGYERHVLEGAGLLLPSFAGIEVELSLVPVYEGAPLIEETIMRLRQQGFCPVSFEDAFVDPKTAQVLQVNGIFRHCG